ncbi:hypothetical protein GOB05_15150 [Sinorhizobium meliloti]|uniref:hypothetical protein n=1 Tax=Rhizobium meliloti TaxID=382 RepID=UPI000FDCD7F6|nr:hypothetical protein [Sinorhizobium meliloti]MDW9841304.1 hypothetical protein [Sinorhizobium meliloti]RVG08504.1 hypothetical protein CN230_21080 [Sinorhizobium meliloti]
MSNVSSFSFDADSSNQLLGFVLSRGSRALVEYISHKAADYNAASLTARNFHDSVAVTSEDHVSKYIGPFTADERIDITGYSVRDPHGNIKRPSSNIRVKSETKEAAVIGFDDWGNDGDFDDIVLRITKQQPPF